MYIGTTNPYKVKEISALLNPLGLEIIPFQLQEEPEEVGFSLMENAIAKARVYAQASDGITLSEDSGLFVTSLNNLPGIWSARFSDFNLDKQLVINSGRTRTEMDTCNNERVLSLMTDIAMPYRAASFKIALVIASPDDILFSTETEYGGWISETCKGDDGFGYDPIFVGNDTFGKTLAEIDGVRKNLRSHRKRALNDLFMWASANKDLLK